MKRISSLLFCYLGFLLADPAMATVSIRSFVTDKARYNPGDTVTFTAETSATASQNCSARLTIRHLDRKVAELQKHGLIIGKKSDTITLQWTAPAADFSGYRVQLDLIREEDILVSAFTAVDVSSDWTRFPRYGYLADFEAMSPDRIDTTIQRLNTYHINGLQFYDWQWKHQKPFPGTVEHPADDWEEIARRPVNRETVEHYITTAHRFNMMAMNYNLLFGALNGYEKDGVDPAWALYGKPDGTDPDTHTLPSSWLSSHIHLMNPANTNWQHFIIARENEVHQLFAFDGWHIDQLGGRGTRYTKDGDYVDLAQTYRPFLERTKKEMNTRLVMNAVGSYALTEIAQTDGLDFLYTEIWPWDGCRHYGHLKDTIERGWRDSNHQYNMVLAAYMNYDLHGRGNFNLPGVLMTDAVIFSAGGSHLELGDHGLLCSEYFPNRRLSMSPELMARLKAYYTFSVAYQNWLRDLSIRPVQREVLSRTPDIAFSTTDTPGHIWHYARTHEDGEILHLINLTGHNHNHWRDDQGDQPAPPVIAPLQLIYFTDADIQQVFTASPDSGNGQLTQLPLEPVKINHRKAYRITIPSLEYWRMIVLKTAN